MIAGVTFALIVIGVVAGLIYLKINLKICEPNEILIFSGKKRRLKDGTVIGYRVMKGGRGLKIPIIETVSKMSLATIPIEIEIDNALAKGMIQTRIKAIAHTKIAGSEEEGLNNAIERLLGKSQSEIAQIAKDNIEGALRGVLATLAPEEANDKRIEFAQKVQAQASEDLRKLGMILDAVKIEDISDKHGYLDAIGRQKNAEIIRDARIVEAQSEAEAKVVQAQSKRKARDAEISSEKDIIQYENELRIKTAKLQAESNRAETIAEIAREIARVQELEKMEEVKIQMNKKRSEAEVVIPAQAQMKAKELLASGESARILESGKATAEAIKLMRQEWEKGNTKELFLIQLLPDIIGKVSNVISDNLKIEKLTIVDGGAGGGVSSHVRNLAGSVVSFLEQIKSVTGLDIPQLLAGKKEADNTLKKELP
jgi:flotillin